MRSSRKVPFVRTSRSASASFRYVHMLNFLVLMPFNRVHGSLMMCRSPPVGTFAGQASIGFMRVFIRYTSKLLGGGLDRNRRVSN